MIAVGGCAQLAGIDDTNGSRRPPDAVAVTRMSIGATVDSAPLDLGGLSATFLVPDGQDVRRVPAVTGAAGTWTSHLFDPVPVEFTLPDAPAPIPRLFAFPAPQLQVLFAVFEHPGSTAAPDGATFTVTAPLDVPIAAADSFQTFVVGAWLQRTFVAGEIAVGAGTLGPVTYAFTPGNSVAGRPAPDVVTARDAFLILRYAGAALTGVAEATPFDQTAMATTVTTQQMTTVVPDQTLDVKLTPAAFGTRYTAARPAVGGLTMSWSLVASPAYKLGSTTGPGLQGGTLTMADGGITTKFGNPFATRGWNTVLSLATSQSRVYTPTGTTTPVTLGAGMSQFLAPPPAGSVLNLPAGLPILIAIDGTPLSIDGQTYQRPIRFPRVTFVSDAPPGATGPVATFYGLQVIDLVPNQAGTALDRRIVLTAASHDPTFDLPPELFEVGHSYTLRAVTTLGGYPAIDTGDLVTRELPLAQGFLDSAVFTVMP